MASPAGGAGSPSAYVLPVLTLGVPFGLVLARLGLGLLVSLAERYSPRANEIRLDGMVLDLHVREPSLEDVFFGFSD